MGKLDICHAQFDQILIHRQRFRDTVQMMEKAFTGLTNERFYNRVLTGEIFIQSGRAVIRTPGDFPQGKLMQALFHDERQSSLQYGLSSALTASLAWGCIIHQRSYLNKILKSNTVRIL